MSLRNRLRGTRHGKDGKNAADQRDAKDAEIERLNAQIAMLEEHTLYECADDSISLESPTDWLEKRSRAVRDKALEDAASLCYELESCEENTEDYRNGAGWCKDRILSMKGKP